MESFPVSLCFIPSPTWFSGNGLLLNIDNQEEALRFDVGLFCVLPDRKQDILWVGDGRAGSPDVL